MIIDGVKKEKYGWRDEAISRRHRLYGSACAMVDLDFVVIEYHLKRVVALIEYKHKYGEKRFDIRDSNYQALIDLADRSGLPFFIVFYNPNIWHYKIYPGNEESSKWVEFPKIFTEKDYVRFLYKIRYLAVKDEVLDKLPQSTYQRNNHESHLP